MIRKNISYHKEGFKVYDNFYFVVELDVAGFEQKLIEKGIKELSDKKIWHKIDESLVLSGDINQASLNYTDEKLIFLVIKQKLIEFRDLVLREK